MEEFPATRPSLLARLRSRDDESAWREFSDLYAPLVYRFARRKGLQDADAADLLQDVFRKLAVELPRFEYDPRRGAFRSWLFTILRQQLADFLGRKSHETAQPAEWAIQAGAGSEPMSAAGDEEIWNREWQQQLLEWSMHRVQREFGPVTWMAFVRTALDGEAVESVSQELSMTAGAIYVAKSRVLSRIKEEIRRFDGEQPDGTSGLSDES